MFARFSLFKRSRKRSIAFESYCGITALAAAVYAAHEFNLARNFHLSQSDLVAEWLGFEILTLVACAFFARRRIQEKEHEIARRIRLEQHARRLAHQDPLTKVANRRKFYKVLNAAINSPPLEGAHALLLLDLNGFKKINDRFGHRTGDLMLVQFAKRLNTITRNDETIARLGGDEFAVVALNVRGKKGVQALADRLVTCLNEPVLLGAVEHALSASVGVSLITRKRVKSDELMRRADVALYQAKASKHSTVAIYHCDADTSAGLVSEAQERVEVLAEATPADLAEPALAAARTSGAPRLRLLAS